jgi:hypothetical protein
MNNEAKNLHQMYYLASRKPKLHCGEERRNCIAVKREERNV